MMEDFGMNCKKRSIVLELPTTDDIGDTADRARWPLFEWMLDKNFDF